MSGTREVLEAELTWTGARFEPGVRVAVEGGRITGVGTLDVQPTRRLARRALLPGLVDAHSHAFQRGLRGSGQRFPTGSGDFWSWRDAMYALVERLDGQAFRDLCVRAFEEMRDAGITTVGEFHYLHHAAADPDFALDELVLDAAAEAGIRLALLQVHYRTGGIDRPLDAAQRRFDTVSVESYLASLDRLAERLDPATQSLGVVSHSVRAVPIEEIVALGEEATRRGLPYHLHVEERRDEIDACVARYGARPMELLVERLSTCENVVAVHATHTDPNDMERFLGEGGRVCVCPLTEADLGDGIPALEAVHQAGGRLSLGSDQNARISMVEEMRWLEYGQRLATERRGLLTHDGDAARSLLAIATEGGGAALGIGVGTIETDAPADFVALDLDSPALAGMESDDLLPGWVFGAGNRSIAATCVAGSWRDTNHR